MMYTEKSRESLLKARALKQKISMQPIIDSMKSHDDEYREHLASKPEPDPICMNCKYWLRSMMGNGNFGSCTLSRIPNAKMHSGCGVKTHVSFGCNQFKIK